MSDNEFYRASASFQVSPYWAEGRDHTLGRFDR